LSHHSLKGLNLCRGPRRLSFVWLHGAAVECHKYVCFGGPRFLSFHTPSPRPCLVIQGHGRCRSLALCRTAGLDCLPPPVTGRYPEENAVFICVSAPFPLLETTRRGTARQRGRTESSAKAPRDVLWLSEQVPRRSQDTATG